MCYIHSNSCRLGAQQLDPLGTNTDTDISISSVDFTEEMNKKFLSELLSHIVID